ncbi:peptidase M26 [Bacteroides congonensis]|uniref:peptidase M26 n=1 Tax=Bacteroides congonensis TaxID=1871006 RepID=UPI003A8B2B79
MKKVYHLLGIVLLGTIALTSCEEDKIVNENTGGGNDTGKNLADYTFSASIKQAEPLVRANLQNDVYAWNSGDAVTVWNRNLGAGYNFTAASAVTGRNAEFSGKAAMGDGHKLVAVFPPKEAQTFNELSTFSIPDVCVQTGKTAELTNTTFMVATGEVAENKIPALVFSPLTALIQFNLKNTSDRELKIRHITVESDDNVFPAELKIDDSGTVQSLSGMRNKITLDLGEQLLAVNEILSGYLNILPTTYNDTRLMKDKTELSVTVNIWNGETEQDVIVLKKVQVQDMGTKAGLDMNATAYQFTAGRHYEMNFNVDYRFQVPEEGYLIDEEGDIHIYNKKGLLGWKQILNEHRKAVVTLEKEYIKPDGVLDLAGEEWESIKSFEGELEGNGVVIDNLAIGKEGFVTTNNGVIRNLLLKNVSFVADVTASAGALVAENNGNITNCAVENISATVTKPVNFGGLVGTNTQPGKVENCRVVSGTINLNLNGADSGNANLGGLVGQNYGGSGIVLNSYVGAVAINHPTNSKNASNVGGLVGWNNVGKVKGCYSLANLVINCSTQTGGLVGVNANGTVLASYAAGSIGGKVLNNTGGLIGFNNGGNTIVTACYATTQLSATTTAVNKFGAFIGTNNGNAKESYFVNATVNNATGNNSSNGINQVTTDKLKGKARYMNLAIEEAETGFGFNYKANEDATTSTEQPLILQPAVPVPGFGGSDFGDGGDI